MKSKLSALLLVLVFSLLFVGGAEARNNYDAPAAKLRGDHGKLIWSWKAPEAVRISSAAWTRNLLYTSRTPEGQKIEASGTVAVPKGRAPRGGWPLIVFHHGTTGIADACAPSKGSSLISSYASVGDMYQVWLQAGYAVALPDYQGLGTPGMHRYLVGGAEGRSALDIIPAAHSLARSLSNKYALVGHSQGAQAAIFSASLAKSYVAKRYRHVGTVAYAPPSALDLQARFIGALGSEPSSLTALATLIVKGANAKAGASVQAVLSPRIFDVADPVLAGGGKSLWQQTDITCLPQLGAKTASSGGLAPSQFLATNDWDNDVNLKKIEPELKKMNPALKFSGPMLLAQGTADSTVLKSFTDGLAGDLQILNPERVEYSSYAGADHSSILSAAQPDTLSRLSLWFGR